MDSVTYSAGALVGPPLAALLFAASPVLAFAVCSLQLAAALLLLRCVRDPWRPEPDAGTLTRDIVEGVRYFAGNAVLRWIAVCAILLNIAQGGMAVLVPTVLVHELGLASWTVGAVLGLSALGNTVASLVSGRFISAGSEARLMGWATVASGAGAVLFLLHSVAGAALAAIIIGLAQGPFWVPLYSLRQRATDQRMFARAFAISATVNYAGVPFGALLAGQLLGRGMDTAAVVVMAGGSFAGVATAAGLGRARRRQLREQ